MITVCPTRTTIVGADLIGTILRNLYLDLLESLRDEFLAGFPRFPWHSTLPLRHLSALARSSAQSKPQHPTKQTCMRSFLSRGLYSKSKLPAAVERVAAETRHSRLHSLRLRASSCHAFGALFGPVELRPLLDKAIVYVI